MNPVLTYIFELNIAISLCYVLYIAAFRKDSNFNLRRSFLLTGMLISFFLPLIHIQLSHSPQIAGTNVFTLEEIILSADRVASSGTHISFKMIPQFIYLLVASGLTIKFIFNLLFIALQIRRSESIIINNKKVFVSSKLHASSFFRSVFIDPDKVNPAEINMIVEHENIHASLWHSVDRLLSEILLILGWLNPVTWMLRKSIIVNHEYQADNKVIESGTDQITYQLTILNQYIGNASISNHFSNQIKNRITMLNKNYKKSSRWKSLLLLPLSIALILLISCETSSIKDTESETSAIENQEEEVFFVVEEMPHWPGNDDMVMETRKFIAKNLKYPTIAKENNAEGKVFVTFMVTKEGKVIVPDPSIMPPETKKSAEKGAGEEVVVVSYRTIDPETKMPNDEIVQAFKDECVRVIELMPDLIPGKQRGKNVNVLFTFPITFKLQ